MNKNLRPAAAAAYEPVQKHKVTPSILGWLNDQETNRNKIILIISYGSGHEGAAVLLPGFATIW